MTPKPAGWDELHLSENPAVELLESLGYTYVPPEDLEQERPSLKEGVLTDRLAAALKRLNPWLSETNVAAAVKTVTQIPATSLAEANETLHTSLTYGIALEQDRGDGRKSHSLRFLDFDNPDNNEWIVTRQYRVQGSKKHIIPDVVAFVNGLPLAVIESKSPTKGDGWKSEAVEQLHRYQEAGSRWKGQGAPKLFEPAQILVGTCGERAVYGTVGTPERFFLEWKEPYPLTHQQLEDRLGRPPKPQDILLYGLLEPNNLLDIVRNFVVFEVESGRSVRKLTRYRQFIAVNEAMRRIRTAPKPSARGGVVWHTQGSGKSLTMLWLALKLRRDPGHQQPTIVIVTDRTKLDKQIAGVFTACGFPNPERADSVRGLRRILEHPTGKTVMTTIQKFQDITAPGGNSARRAEVHPTLSETTNIFVMVDEAHRTQYRSLAANMRQALPNGCFLGFTGTPIDKKDRSTLKTFGPYIDTYTIEQAVQDKATVPIFYESRLPELQIIGQTIDKVFDHVFADRTDEERAVIKQRYATEQAIAGAPRRIEAICLDLIDHFTQFIAPNGFKAQVVATSRHAAVTYKEALDRLNGPESTLLMSAGHNDEERLARWHLPREKQDRLIERFKDPDDPLSILIVCDMLLTGFDAPVEQVMYLDAPLREHTLLQAIARVNRPHGDEKTYGLVVDYWGVSAKLQDALAVFSKADIQGALTPNVDELPRLESRHAAAMRFFQAVADPDDLDACVQVLEPEDVRAEFDLAFRRFAQSMDMLLPDRRALRYRGDLLWLGKIRGTAQARYRDKRLDLSGCGEKVRKLIADAVAADGIEILVKEVQLFSPEFDEKVDALRTDEARASEMEHAIRHEINVRVEENPVFYQSLRKRLEEIIEQHRLERIDAAEQLKLFASLKEELQGEQNRAQDMGLDARGFAIYGLLEQTRPLMVEEKMDAYSEANRDLASLIDESVTPFTDIVDWWEKDDVQRQMRSKIKRHLRASGVGPGSVESLASDILDLTKVRTDR